jgi:hypothetical protein
VSEQTTDRDDLDEAVDFDDLEALLRTDDDHDGLQWLDRIACADLDPAVMFVEAGHTIDPAVVETCRSCPVRHECLLHAYRRPVRSGYLAGLSPSQRRKMSFGQALEYVQNDPPRT